MVYLNKNMKIRNQCMVTLIANIATLMYGFGLGWSSPNIPLLLSEDSPLITGIVSKEQSSWISSLFCIGGGVGSVLFSLLLQFVGPKIPVTLIGVAEVISWGLIALWPHVIALYVARFLIGLAGGGILVVIPVFITDISNDNIRGALGSVMGVAMPFGCLIAFVLSHYFKYTVLPSITTAMAVAFVLGFQLIPDTPKSLLDKGKYEAALKSLRFYKQFNAPSETDAEVSVENQQNHGECQEIDNSLNVIAVPQNPFEENKNVATNYSHNESQGNDKIGKFTTATYHDESEVNDNSVTLADFFVPETIKGILIGFVLIVMTILSGSFSIITYVGHIFKEAGSQLHPDVCAIIIGSLQVVASCLSIYLIERAGRKVLLLVSSGASAFFLAILSLYFFIQSKDVDLSSVHFIPLISLSLMMFVVVGITMMAFVVIVELLPPKLRGIISSALILLFWILGFVCVKYFHNMVDIFGMHGCMFFFAGCCAFEFVFLLLFLPETKGKSYEEIKEALSKKVS